MAKPADIWTNEIEKITDQNFITKVTFGNNDAENNDREGFATFTTAFTNDLKMKIPGNFDPNTASWGYKGVKYVFFINQSGKRVTCRGIDSSRVDGSIEGVVIINDSCKMAEFESYYTDAIITINRLDPAPETPISATAKSIKNRDLESAMENFALESTNDTFKTARDALTAFVDKGDWMETGMTYEDIQFNAEGDEITSKITRSTPDQIFGAESKALLANFTGFVTSIALKNQIIDQKIKFELPVSFASLRNRIAPVPFPTTKGRSVWYNDAFSELVADCNKVKNCAGLVNALGAYNYRRAESSSKLFLPKAVWMKLMSTQSYQRAARKFGYVVASMEYRLSPEFQDSQGFLNITSDEMPNALQFEIAKLLGIATNHHRLLPDVVLASASRQISDLMFEWCFNKLYPEQFNANIRTTAPYFQRFPVATDDDAQRFPLLTWRAASQSNDTPRTPTGLSLIGKSPPENRALLTRGYGEIMIEFKFCAAGAVADYAKLAGNTDYVTASENAAVYARIGWNISDLASTFSVRDGDPAMTLINQATVLFYLQARRDTTADTKFVLPTEPATFDDGSYTDALGNLVDAAGTNDTTINSEAAQTLIGTLLYSNIAQKIEESLYCTIGDSPRNMDVYGALSGINARSPQSIQKDGSGTLTPAAGVTVLGLGAARMIPELKEEARKWWRRP